MANKKKIPAEIYLDYIYIPVVKEKYNLVFAENPYEAMKEMDCVQKFADQVFDGNLRDAEDDLQGANAMTVTLHVDNALMLILPFNVKPGVLAHECFHLMHMIYRRKGVKFCPESEEAFAYLLDYLVEEVTDYRKLMVKARKKFKAEHGK